MRVLIVFCLVASGLGATVWFAQSPVLAGTSISLVFCGALIATRLGPRRGRAMLQAGAILGLLWAWATAFQWMFSIDPLRWHDLVDLAEAFHGGAAGLLDPAGSRGSSVARGSVDWQRFWIIDSWFEIGLLAGLVAGPPVAVMTGMAVGTAGDQVAALQASYRSKTRDKAVRASEPSSTPRPEPVPNDTTGSTATMKPASAAAGQAPERRKISAERENEDSLEAVRLMLENHGAVVVVPAAREMLAAAGDHHVLLAALADLVVVVVLARLDADNYKDRGETWANSAGIHIGSPIEAADAAAVSFLETVNRAFGSNLPPDCELKATAILPPGVSVTNGQSVQELWTTERQVHVASLTEGATTGISYSWPQDLAELLPDNSPASAELLNSLGPALIDL